MSNKIVKYLPGTIGLILFVILGYVALTKTTIPKTQATYEQVKNVLSSQGYETLELTEKYKTKYPDTSLIQCIGTQKDDLHFEFYTFSSNKGAQSIYRQAYSQLVTNGRGYPYAEHDTQVANYSIYTLRSKGKYSVAIYVGTTAVYAYCNEENEDKLADIIYAIDYFSSHKKQVVKSNSMAGLGINERERSISGFIFIALLIPITWVSLHWLWRIVCSTAGISAFDVQNYRRENRTEKPTRKKRYDWMLSNSSNPIKFKRVYAAYHLCFIPCLVCLAIATAGFLTPALDKVIDIAGMIVLAITVAMGAIGAFVNK